MRCLLPPACLLLLAALPCALAGQSFPNLRWHKFYDNHSDDVARKLIRCTDGNLLLAGNSHIRDRSGQRCTDLWFIKVTPEGDMIWEQEIALPDCEELGGLVAGRNGEIAFAGLSRRQEDSPQGRRFQSSALIGQLSAEGEVEWLQALGSGGRDEVRALAEGAGGERVYAGLLHSALPGQQASGRGQAWLFQQPSGADPGFQAQAGGSGTDWAEGLAVCAAGDLILCGSSFSADWGDQNLSRAGGAFVARFSARGLIRWARTFPAPGGASLRALCEAPDGRIFAAGSQASGPYQPGDFWWMRLTAEGKLIERFALPGPHDEQILSLSPCAAGGYVMGGYSLPAPGSGPYLKGGEDFWVLRIDSRGELLWRSTFGGPAHERCADVLEYSPGVYYALGEKRNTFQGQPGRSDRDFWLLQIGEYPPDSIQASIFVRAREFRISRNTPTRFRAEYAFGERFLWDFGDGSSSNEEQPLKTYEYPGAYRVQLTVFANEHCSQTVFLDRLLEVW
jgi:hypothetical protein